MDRIKCLIIGSGPAGYTAAIYAGRANLSPVLYCGLQTGGQLTTTTIVENFPGYPDGVDANQMMMDLQKQAKRFGADIRDGIITKADFSSRPFKLTTDRGVELEADSVIVATGASAKYLGLADEEKYKGRRRECLCHLRRILLPQEGRSRRRRWRYSMRGSKLSRRTVQESIYDCAQALSACK